MFKLMNFMKRILKNYKTLWVCPMKCIKRFVFEWHIDKIWSWKRLENCHHFDRNYRPCCWFILHLSYGWHVWRLHVTYLLVLLSDLRILPPSTRVVHRLRNGSSINLNSWRADWILLRQCEELCHRDIRTKVTPAWLDVIDGRYQ